MAAPQKEWLDPSARATEDLSALMHTAGIAHEDIVVVQGITQKNPIPNNVNESVPDASEQALVGDAKANAPVIPVDVARKEAPILQSATVRDQSRLLVLTRDETILHEGSLSHRRFTDLRVLFLEVHIVLLDFRTAHEVEPIVRLFENVWVYTTKSSSWWTLGYDAYKIIEEQLVFSGGFRADIVLAEDPFVSGLIGYYIAKKHERSFQIHVYEDFFDESFVESQEHPALYEWVTHFVLKRVKSVRTKTEFQRSGVLALNPKITASVDLLPGYYDLEAWKNLQPTINLKERYPQFKFIILHISSMRAVSHSAEVLMGVAPILRRYPSIGLVILGNGPLRSQLERQVITLGLQNQVEFEPMPHEIVSHMKSAHLLIHISEDGAEDDIVLAAATVRLPMIVNSTGLAGRLFVDGESALFCVTTDNMCITENINRLLNENQTRSHVAMSAHDTVFERVEQNYDGYLASYRESVERSVAENS